MLNYPTNWHFQYRAIVRHWHPQSEKYAGGDCLLTALNDGWEVNEQVIGEEHWRAGTRRVMVYRFELSRDSDLLTMPVITNPFVERLIAENALRVVLQRKGIRTS